VSDFNVIFILFQHVCNFCGINFLSKDHLKVHEQSHTGEKPYECDVCGRKVAYRKLLVTRYTLHTNIKPYASKVYIPDSPDLPEVTSRHLWPASVQDQHKGGASSHFGQSQRERYHEIAIGLPSQYYAGSVQQNRNLNKARFADQQGGGDGCHSCPTTMVATSIWSTCWTRRSHKRVATPFKQENKVDEPEMSISESWQDQESGSPGIPGMKIELIESRTIAETTLGLPSATMITPPTR
jgi:hypothetical protein